MRILTISAVFVLAAGAAYSQTPPPAAGPAPGPGPTPPEVIKPPAAATAGVITPPGNVDPDINKPTPPGVDFPTPSVHPPATDQNGSTVVPK